MTGARAGRFARFTLTSLTIVLFASRALAQDKPPATIPQEPNKHDEVKPAPATDDVRTKHLRAPVESAAQNALARVVGRAHTVAELEAGIIALPNAPISARQQGGDTGVPFFGTIGRGDATPQLGLHVLYRWSADFAIGAGVLFAPSPTSDPEYGGATGLARSHSRSYLFLGTEGRYVPLHYKFFEAWVGLSVGGIVVADRFVTEAAEDRAPILGQKDVTIRTEGFAMGLQGGGSYYLSENWITGATLRGYQWILPDTPRCSPIGNCASLSGGVLAFELGLTIGYRLPL